MRFSDGLRTVAVFEAAKGTLVLLAGFGVLSLIDPSPVKTVLASNHRILVLVLLYECGCPSIRRPRLACDMLIAVAVLSYRPHR